MSVWIVAFILFWNLTPRNVYFAICLGLFTPLNFDNTERR